LSSKNQLKFAVDRIEGDIAVLIYDDDDSVKVNLPVSLLPENIAEGDHLKVSVTKDELSRAEMKRRIEELLKDE
jgi:hypothetical protein